MIHSPNKNWYDTETFMAEPESPIPLDSEPPEKQPAWGTIVAVAAIIGILVLGFWIAREKRNDETRQAVLTALDKELGNDEAAVNAQREKIMDLTRRVEALRTSIQMGEVKNGKAAVAEFNKLAAEQREARDTFAKMADAYNKKVAQYRNIQQ
jgi:FtsZ-interacting cell division protein ZipA